METKLATRQQCILFYFRKWRALSQQTVGNISMCYLSESDYKYLLILWLSTKTLGSITCIRFPSSCQKHSDLEKVLY